MDMLGKQTTVDTNKLQTLLKKIHMCFKVLLLNHYVDDYLCRLLAVDCRLFLMMMMMMSFAAVCVI